MTRKHVSTHENERRVPQHLSESLQYIEYLKDPYRTAVYLYCNKKLSYTSIAPQLGKPIGTVKTQVSRGLSMLWQIKNQRGPLQTHKDTHSVSVLAEIKARLHELKAPYETAVRLHCVELLSYARIGTLLNIPQGTVKARVSRGLKLLGLSSHSPKKTLSSSNSHKDAAQTSMLSQEGEPSLRERA